MSTEETIRMLGQRVAFLEQELLRRAPEITAQGFLIISLIAWMGERHPDIDFDRVAEEMLRSIDDLSVSTGDENRDERIRAGLLTQMSETLATARRKMEEMRRESKGG